MSFIVLMMAIFLEKLSNWRKVLQKDQWWYAQLKRSHRLCAGQPILTLILALALPLVGLALLLSAVQPLIYGLLLIPIHLFIVLYSFSRLDVRASLGPFRDAWRRDDLQAAHLAAQRDLLIQAEDAPGLLQAVQGYLFWQGFQGFFVVIFFYVLGGPVAALGYRLLVLSAEQVQHPAAAGKATRLLHILDWLPARLLSLSFALIGNFITVSKALMPDLLCIREQADSLLNKTGRAAIESPNQADGKQGVLILDNAWLLLVRSAVFWYASIAVWTLFF